MPSAQLIYQMRSGIEGGPRLILLHGLGGDEHAMSLFARSIPAAFTVISPRAPIAIEPGMFPGYTDRGYSWIRPATPPDRVSFAPAIDQLRRLIAAFDRSPVYLMGFSQGAALSLCIFISRTVNRGRCDCFSRVFAGRRDASFDYTSFRSRPFRRGALGARLAECFSPTRLLDHPRHRRSDRADPSRSSSPRLPAIDRRARGISRLFHRPQSGAAGPQRHHALANRTRPVR